MDNRFRSAVLLEKSIRTFAQTRVPFAPSHWRHLMRISRKDAKQSHEERGQCSWDDAQQFSARHRRDFIVFIGDIFENKRVGENQPGSVPQREKKENLEDHFVFPLSVCQDPFPQRRVDSGGKPATRLSDDRETRENPGRYWTRARTKGKNKDRLSNFSIHHVLDVFHPRANVPHSIYKNVPLSAAVAGSIGLLRKLPCMNSEALPHDEGYVKYVARNVSARASKRYALIPSSFLK
ncbi:hypothetical protein EVAR_28942_1 [Eumeta japonica]|uniref:Uncharacterized protein n=1 Tax=Eumeta variegata TaxID=151549 RepID=A0A4C1W0Z6_EUMVA|nr:hypothetical protein EVAR_28942_1 [Eumeta japonica]